MVTGGWGDGDPTEGRLGVESVDRWGAVGDSELSGDESGGE